MDGNHNHKLRLEDIGAVLKAIADPTRRRMLDLLAERELSVSRIAARFSISRWAVMKHLRILRSANLVSVRQSGRKRIQRFNPKPLKSVEAWISQFASHRDGRPRRH